MIIDNKLLVKAERVSSGQEENKMTENLASSQMIIQNAVGHLLNDESLDIFNDGSAQISQSNQWGHSTASQTFETFTEAIEYLNNRY